MPDGVIVEIEDLAAALEVGSSSLVSFVGGGGKTTALFALGRQLPGRVVLTTTTKMGADRRGGFSPLLDPDDAELAAALDADRVVLAWGGELDHRALGVSADTCARWTGLADHVVVETDGSRRRPFKAPAAHEPVVPAATSLLVACVGAAAFDVPIEEAAHRPEILAALVGCAPGDRLTAPRLAAVLRSEIGSQKGRPPGARFVVLLNQVTEAHRNYVAELEAALDGITVHSVAPFTPERSPG